jgi:uncharacterized protein (DUF1697 family)
MQRYIAFLRAINVGGHTVKMEQLRSLFAELEYANVETFIASGNVIFEAADKQPQALEKRIEAHLQQALGYAVATFIRTPAELKAVAAYQPFPPAELETAGGSLYIGFLPVAPTDEARRKLMALRTEIDDFHVHQRELYWLARQGMGRSTISGALLEKTLGMPATLRNVTTVRKLAAKYPV